MDKLRIEKSSVKEQFRPKSSRKWHAGAFDYELTFIETDRNLTDELCDWLANNCSENFIVARDTSELIAGGCSDNLLAWNNRSKYFGSSDVITELRIRLHKADVTMFRLVWMLD